MHFTTYHNISNITKKLITTFICSILILTIFLYLKFSISREK